MRYTIVTVAPHDAITGKVHVALRYNTKFAAVATLTKHATLKLINTLKNVFLFKGPWPFKLKKYPATL
jgi:hypothetical protein